MILSYAQLTDSCKHFCDKLDQTLTACVWQFSRHVCSQHWLQYKGTCLLSLLIAQHCSHAPACVHCDPMS